MIFDVSRIAANNGWAMAFTGALLVLLGLAILAFIISQLHKIIGFFEQKAEGHPMEEAPPVAVAPLDMLNDLQATANLYQALTSSLGGQFDLVQLHRLAQKDQLPHPHLTIRSLREAGYLIPAGNGTYNWKSA